MGDSDFAPPAMPGVKQENGAKGFLRRFLFKEDSTQKVVVPQQTIPVQRTSAMPLSIQKAPSTLSQSPVSHAQVDLDEIKRKLGLDEEVKPATPVVPLQPQRPVQQQAPQQKVEINDWSAEDIGSKGKKPSSWDLELDITAEDVKLQNEAKNAKKIDERKKTASAPVQKTPSIQQNDNSHADEDPPAPLPPDHSLATLHNEAIEKHLVEVDRTKQQIAKKIEHLTIEKPQLPEWHLQDKPIQPHEYFILRNSQPIKSLAELITVLDYIDDDTFEHHVNEYRNDFANWIRDTIKNPELADEIAKAQNKAGMIRILVWFSSKAAKKVMKETEKIHEIVKKREQVVKKLGDVETQITQLKSQLLQKTQELENEKKKVAQAIKERIDLEVKKRTENDRKTISTARTELAAAKAELATKTREYETKIRSISMSHEQSKITEEKATTLLARIRAEERAFEQRKAETAQLFKDAVYIKRMHDELQRLDQQTKDNLSMITKKEIELSRREETLRQREKKINTDLTKVHDEQRTLVKLKEEHAKREAATRKIESEAKKTIVEAEDRMKTALATERGSRERMQAEMKKIEQLRKHIDKTLAKVMGQKKKVTSAIELRKNIEEALLKTKKEVAAEKERMEQEEYASMIKEKIQTTPIGQPDRKEADELMSVEKKGIPLYQKVEECRQALDKKDVQAAKRMYNTIRDEFAKAHLSMEERNTLYNSIRELYDDIHLAMLG